jgi:transposase
MRAPLPDLDALDIEALKALILSQDEEKQRQLTELAQLRQEHQAELAARSEQIEHLRLVVEKLRRMLFGRKSEKLSIQLDQLELQLEEMEAIHAALASVPVCDAKPDSTGTQPARKPLPEHLPRQIVTHEPKESCCPECGGNLRHFGDDVSEQLDYVPESFRVIRHIRPKFACGKCETVIEAPAPSRPIARGLAAPGLLAHVLVSKIIARCIARQRFTLGRESSSIDPRWPGG